MAENRTQAAKRFLAKELVKLSGQGREVVERFISRGRIARNVAHEFEQQLTFRRAWITFISTRQGIRSQELCQRKPAL
jgi:stringent starvation protein B